jgi:PAS domain-containing protein
MSKPRSPKADRQVASNKGFQRPSQLFRVVAEAATDAIIAIDERSTTLFINKAAERIFGYSISEMLHQQVTMLMPHYVREAHQGAIGMVPSNRSKAFLVDRAQTNWVTPHRKGISYRGFLWGACPREKTNFHRDRP